MARLRASQAGAAAAGTGDPLPDFALPDAAGRIHRLAKALAHGPVVVARHRGGWCDFCQLNLLALAEAHPRLRAAGGQLMAVAPQRAAHAAAHLAAAGAAFPMLADIGCGVATLLGLTVVVDDGLAAELRGFGIDLADANGDEGRLLPIPATFVVGRDGTVVARHLDPDPRIRWDPEEIVQAVAAAAS